MQLSHCSYYRHMETLPSLGVIELNKTFKLENVVFRKIPQYTIVNLHRLSRSTNVYRN